MPDFETNPTDVYENKELQDKYTQLVLDEEPIAVIIPFEKEVDSTVEDIIDDNPEDNNSTVNFTEFLEEEITDEVKKESGLSDNFLETDSSLDEEQSKEKLLELKLKVIDSDKDEGNLVEPKNTNYITEASAESDMMLFWVDDDDTLSDFESWF